MPKRTGYIVANPRGLPSGSWILKVGGTRFHEGDPITPKDAFTPEGWASWLAGGFVVEVNGG